MIQVDIKGFDKYQITDNGRVWSKKKKKFLKPFKNNVGYLQVYLYKNGVSKWYKIHRLVAEAFIPNPNKLPEVNHKNEDKTLNTVENLEWCDRKYNVNFGTAKNRIAESKKRKVYQYTLDGKLFCVFNSISDAAKQGFNSGDITNCCRNKYSQHKGYKWSYNPL